MKVVITGGNGFIGRLLARRLLDKRELAAPGAAVAPIDELVLFDSVAPLKKIPSTDGRVKQVAGEVADPRSVARVIDRPDIAIFHLASIVSGGAEEDFDRAIQVNLQGFLNVLEAARVQGSCPRIVFASSIAVFGGASMPQSVGDSTKQTPRTTYGMTKAIGELLVNDYSRKRYVDGRSARLPTVIIRPGKPNKAASSFASSVFREPLNGQECVLPVPLPTVMPIAGYRSVVDGIVRLHDIDGEDLGDDRAINFPSLSVSLEEMIASLQRVAGGRRLGPIRVEEDAAIARIVRGWPMECSHDRALALGLPRDSELDTIVRAYIEDFLDNPINS